MDTVVMVFVASVVVLGIIAFYLLIAAACPTKKIICNFYKNPNLSIDTYYFYFEKAAAYRILYLFDYSYHHIIKVIGVCSTVILIYCSFEAKDYLLLFSLFAAISEVINLIFPLEKAAKIHVQCAREMEFALLDIYIGKTDDEVKKILHDTYVKVEGYIADGLL